VAGEASRLISLCVVDPTVSPYFTLGWLHFC
jgi:hypothetical protein